MSDMRIESKSLKFYTFCMSAALIMGTPALAGAQSESQVPATKSHKSSKSMNQAQAKPTINKDMVTQMISSWPKTAKMAAESMLNKYGAPNEATESRLIWNDNGPWKRTIVYKEEVQHNFPMAHKDVLEQVINMDVPADKFDELAAYDGSVIVERTKGEISARCDKEGANILALNLAKDIIDGKKNVEQARQAYAENIRTMMKGQTPALMQKLQFDVARNDITNPDKSVIEMAGGSMSGGTSDTKSGTTMDSDSGMSMESDSMMDTQMDSESGTTKSKKDSKSKSGY